MWKSTGYLFAPIAILMIFADGVIGLRCALPSLDIPNKSLDCDYDYNANLHKGFLKLSDCKSSLNNSAIHCQDYLTDKIKPCKIEIEFRDLFPLQPLNPPTIAETNCNASKIQLDVIFNNLDVTNLTDESAQSFKDMSKTFVIDKCVVKSSSFGKESDMSQLIQKNCFNFIRLEISKVQAELPLTNILPALEDANYPANVSIYIEDSKFKGLTRGAFHIRNNTRIEIKDVDFGGEIEGEAFIFYMKKCEDGLELELKNIGLDTLSKPPIEIFLNEICRGALSKPHITITSLNNNYHRILPRDQFEQLVAQMLPRNDIIFTLYSDPIDCCYADNRWVFELQDNHSRTTNQVDIDCIDLRDQVFFYKNLTRFDELCSTRNVYPILTISIIAIFLLAILLGGFSCICIFYVLPGKGKEKVVHIDHGHSDNHEYSGSNTLRRKKSSIINVTSTQSDANYKVPLMSQVVKKSKESIAKPSAQKQPHAKSPKALKLPTTQSKLNELKDKLKQKRDSLVSPRSPLSKEINARETVRSEHKYSLEDQGKAKSPKVESKKGFFSGMRKSATKSPTPMKQIKTISDVGITNSKNQLGKRSVEKSISDRMSLALKTVGKF